MTASMSLFHKDILSATHLEKTQHMPPKIETSRPESKNYNWIQIIGKSRSRLAVV